MAIGKPVTEYLTIILNSYATNFDSCIHLSNSHLLEMVESKLLPSHGNLLSIMHGDNRQGTIQ
jgi:hypothetical protein